jgi:hypothetical protein
LLCAEFQRHVEKTTQQNGVKKKKKPKNGVTRNFDVFGLCGINAETIQQ